MKLVSNVACLVSVALKRLWSADSILQPDFIVTMTDPDPQRSVSRQIEGLIGF